ncbi:unnamed protein product [Dracunculus medinensis]|uniref:Solute carrier organic anion transporter family member n=1 Tax=Dracunculus medinensis TaxID=318479 RepID=A0A0N4ULC1_DRAME|nr:unnamed protein product [Dracunculus medinensis]
MKNIDEVDEIFVRTFNGSNDSVNAETRSAPGDLQKPSSKKKCRNVKNGFASGPPWPKREKPWSTVCVWQKHQQIQAIEKEINVLANETLVGIRKWRPAWLQRFSSRNWMLLWLCWFCTVQGLLVNGLVPSAITSIERRFQFSSSTIGRIMQFYDFGYVLFCIPVSYFGGRHSKPMVLATGLLLMSGTFRYVFLFCLAHFLHGIGATPLFTLGVSYIDENVGPTLSSLYLGIFYAFAIFGPAFGFLMSSTFLRYHTDFLQSDHQILNIDESDPKWVGAWWIGFQIASFLAVVAVFPILILPKVLPESLKWHRTRLHEETMQGSKRRTPDCCGIPSASKTAAVCGPLLPASGEEQQSLPTISNRGPIWYHIWLDVRHIPIAIYRTLSNGSYMLITIGMAVDGLIITGASTFMSKYLERQFSVAPSKANMLIGCIMVPMAGIGTMFSGFVIQRFRLSCVKTLKFCIALLMCSLLLSPMYLIYCDHDTLAGIESYYDIDVGSSSNQYFMNSTEHPPTLFSTCNQHCDCVDSEYHPVCAEFHDGKQTAFFSPCYAGCDKKYEPLQKFYHNCSCVPNGTKFGPKTVKNGFCESKCTGLFGFLIMFAPFCFFAFAIGVPLISVVLRTVDYAERSFALGIQWILVRVIGTIPAPVLFGWMFDVSCIRYDLDVCSGSCMLYQNKLLADLFLAFSVVGQTIAMVFFICTLIFFSSQMRDDPLPVAATVAVPEATDDIDVNPADLNSPMKTVNEEIQNA